MKYFIDTEFHEYHKQVKCCGIKLEKPIPTIDLISIGIVAEDGREYYAISKDFNVEDAWNSFQLKEWTANPIGKQEYTKEYWLRDNVLKNLFNNKLYHDYGNVHISTIKELKNLVNHFGKTNKQIANDIIKFCNPTKGNEINVSDIVNGNIKNSKEFYGYYADYDWVVFAQLFGKMINLPKGFPMYCNDLKQTFDEKLTGDIVRPNQTLIAQELVELRAMKTLKERKDWLLKYSKVYPKQSNGHNALVDAKWNYELYKFLQAL